MCTFTTLKYAHKSGNGNNCQPLYREYMNGEEGVWGASATPEASGMKRRQIKWKLLLFYESDFFLLRPVYFVFSFNIAMLFIFSQIKKHVFF